MEWFRSLPNRFTDFGLQKFPYSGVWLHTQHLTQIIHFLKIPGKISAFAHLLQVQRESAEHRLRAQAADCSPQGLLGRPGNLSHCHIAILFDISSTSAELTEALQQALCQGSAGVAQRCEKLSNHCRNHNGCQRMQQDLQGPSNLCVDALTAV